VTETGRKKLLVGVLAVLVLVLALRLAGMAIDQGPGPAAAPRRPTVDELEAGGYGTPGPQARPAAPRRARRAGEATTTETAEVVELDLHLLDRQARGYRPGRDPWRYGEPPPPPPPPPPPQPTAEELARMQAEQERLARLRAEQAERLRQEALKPKPQPFTMKYLGSFGPARSRLAVFSDGKAIFNARQGEVLEGKYIVARIGYESVDIQFVGFPDWPAQRLAVGR
jgi:hypothetical protein